MEGVPVLMTTTKVMSDAEVLCAFMEPRPPVIERGLPGFVADNQWTHRWWNWYTRGGQHIPRELDLGALHEIESKLTDEHWDEYVDALNRTATGIPYGVNRNNYPRRIIHATASEKVENSAEPRMMNPATPTIAPASKRRGI